MIIVTNKSHHCPYFRFPKEKTPSSNHGFRCEQKGGVQGGQGASWASTEKSLLYLGETGLPWSICRRGATGGGGGRGKIAPYDFVCFLLVSSAVSHVHDDDTPTPFSEVGKNVSEYPPLSDFFEAAAQDFRAGAAVARHFALPKQTPWRRPCLYAKIKHLHSKALFWY